MLLGQVMSNTLQNTVSSFLCLFCSPWSNDPCSPCIMLILLFLPPTLQFCSCDVMLLNMSHLGWLTHTCRMNCVSNVTSSFMWMMILNAWLDIGPEVFQLCEQPVQPKCPFPISSAWKGTDWVCMSPGPFVGPSSEMKGTTWPQLMSPVVLLVYYISQLLNEGQERQKQVVIVHQSTSRGSFLTGVK